VLPEASKEGEPLRTYEMDLQGGKPQEVGPADLTGVAVATDGQKIAGRNSAGEAVVFNCETKKVQLIPGIGPQDGIEKWTKDGQALLVTTSTPWEAQIYRVGVTRGKRNLLQKVELSEKAGSIYNVRAQYAEDRKTYVYNTRRVLASLNVVEGLE
jgi:hypothetical protein